MLVLLVVIVGAQIFARPISVCSVKLTASCCVFSNISPDQILLDLRWFWFGSQISAPRVSRRDILYVQGSLYCPFRSRCFRFVMCLSLFWARWSEYVQWP